MSEFSSSVMSEFGTYGYGGFQDNARELARLNFQAEVAWPIEQAALRRHGLNLNSRVLDVACGALRQCFELRLRRTHCLLCAYD